MSEATARNGAIFREAYRRGLPNAELWSRLEQADAWTALPAEQAIGALRNAHEYSNRDWFSAINIVYFKWYRKTGYSSDQAGQQQVGVLWQKIAAGGGSPEERKVGIRLQVAFRLLSDLLTRDPSARAPESSEDQAKAKIKSATQAAATQILARLLDCPAAIAGMVTPESIAELEAIRSEFAELRSKTASDDGGLPDVCYGAGQTALALAKSYSIASRSDEARKAFEESASFFEQGGLTEKAADVRATAAALDKQMRGLFDAAAAEKLRELNEVEAKQSDQSALKRINSLLELSRIATSAFDIYAALQQAEAAAVELAKLGFTDPSAVDPAQAVAQWLDVAINRFEKNGNGLLGLVTGVGIWYRTLFSARYARLVAQDAAASEALLVAQSVMDAELKALNVEAAEIELTREAQMREFFRTEMAGEKQASSARNENERRADELAARSHKVDTALNSIQERCNARRGTKVPMDDLLAELVELTTEADNLNTPIYAAKVRLMKAYVLREWGHAPETAAAARDARECLLAGRLASLGSFSEGSERIMFLDTYRREMEAAAMSQNLDEVGAICGTVILDFEKLRYNVSDPYRSASLLVYVSEFYQMRIVTAFRRQRWEEMLETMELIKARSAIRRRGEAISGEKVDSAEIAQLEAEFERLSREEAQDSAVAQKRRQIWDLLSVLRSQHYANALPEFSLEALRKALRADEALVGYFWLNETIFLTICVDRERCEVERIILSDEQLEPWQELFAFIRTLKSSAGRNFERAVQAAGNLFLSPKVREFIRTKVRVIFSPHRGLHLFPFHAVRWDEAEFVGAHFAVRYVPNFSSVMIPWIQRHEPRFFGVAIEQFADASIPVLPGVEADLAKIRAEYVAAKTTATTLFGCEGTRGEFNSWRERPELTRARSVHFGTHGISVLNLPDEPLDARILLQDQWLDCMDIAQWSLAADIVVLSACESGQQSVEFRKMATGGGVPGDEIFGLQSAFFQAGARCVLGALWLVETESSSKLIRSFHEGYARGADVEIALRDAVRNYLADKSAKAGIFYWAPYFLSCVGTAQL